MVDWFHKSRKLQQEELLAGFLETRFQGRVRCFYKRELCGWGSLLFGSKSVPSQLENVFSASRVSDCVCFQSVALLLHTKAASFSFKEYL